MNHEEFLDLVLRLTGTPAKDISDADRQDLDRALSDGARVIDHSQFNELLLIVNKDRVEKSSFRFFFVGDLTSTSPLECSVSAIPAGVDKFQRTALLCFGNFIYAFRELSKARSIEELCQRLGGICESSEDLLGKLQKRRPTVLDIDSIARDETYLVGHISAAEVVAEHGRARRLIEMFEAHPGLSWGELDQAIGTIGNDEQVNALRLLVTTLRKRLHPDASTGNFEALVRTEFTMLDSLRTKATSVQRKGTRNSDIYLTWDHMDIYIATSMRKRWEYEDLYDFSQALMAEPRLQGLNLRYFDPTQSFDLNRVNKGLVEALMLKRAACTVYSVQDTDTLGKDSELAATLAQGKPVIAYAPEIDISKRTAQLISQRPRAIRERLQFVYAADDNFAMTFSSELPFIDEFIPKLDEFEGRMPWRTVTDRALSEKFRQENREAIERLCRVIASAERNLYNKRARTLKETHPLAIQVNLDTGVANGVLVVRDVAKCAELVRRILLNCMEYDVVYDSKLQCWFLVERLTESIYRVVTGNRKLTNCFWNFYRQSPSLERD